MGLVVGDEVELQLVDRTLLVRPIDESARAARVSAAMDSVLARRKSVLRRLAEGAGAPETRAATPKAGKPKPKRR